MVSLTGSTRWIGAFTTLLLIFAAWPVGGAPSDIMIRGKVPAYTDAPVFYNFFWSYYADMKNLELAHEGKIQLGKLGIEPIENFDWTKKTRRSNSFWVRMENFWYLTPLIHSGADRDEAFVRSWFEGWLDAHEGQKPNNYGARDAMSAGFRAMTFVWYLRLLHERGEADSVWVDRICNAVKEHQNYLDNKFHAVSNHGYWEAMGLFETTRVRPDSFLVRIALERLDEMVTAGITEKGFYVERAPFYQIEVMNWITRYVEYFHALKGKGFDWSGLARLEEAGRNMKEAAYYLYDHASKVPQIGDTDAMRFKARRPRSSRRPNVPEVFFDERAGYAIYKDAEARRGRYVVFNVPSSKFQNRMPYHNHNDLFSVYYSHRGEIILGDPGVYTYDNDENRRYFKSASAHNTLLPMSAFVKSGYRTEQRRAGEVLVLEDENGHQFIASLARDKVTRVVRIPKNEIKIEISDTILDEEPYVIFWHMGADVESIRPEDGGRDGWVASDSLFEFDFDVTTKKRRHFLLTISTPAGPPESEELIEIVSGLESPMLGWYSSGHEQKVPIPVIKINLNVDHFANITTSIRPRGY